MKFLTSTWGICILALLINLGVVTGTIMLQQGSLIEMAVARVADQNKEDLPPVDTIEYWTLKFSEFTAMHESLAKKEQELALRERKVLEQENRLKNRQEELQRFEDEIAQKRRDLDDILVTIKDEEMGNLKFLASTYSEMAPDTVVNIFDQMTDDEVVKILLQMKPDVIAPIFSAMVDADTPDGRQSQRVAYMADRIRLHKKNKG